MIYHTVIKNGTVISFDPDIEENFNIGIEDGKICCITKEEITGETEIDARSKYVAPGFIDFHSHVNGRIFSAECLARQGATTTIGGERNFDASIIRKIETEGFLINHGFYISYSFTLRKAVGLQDPSQKASRKQIDDMIALAERFFEFGVLGIHFGLEYAPGTSEEELVDLLTLAQKYNKIAMVHLRKDGYESIESLDEIIRVAKKTGAAINILHLMYTAGLEGLMDDFLNRVQAAREDGCDITVDTGVFAAYPTFSGSSCLGEDWGRGYGEGIGEDRLMVSSGIYAGQRCDKGLFQYLRKEFPTTLITAFVYDEKQIEHALKPSFVYVSTNAAYGPHYEKIGHPETAGTYPRLVGEYVRSRKVLTLHDAIWKISYGPAQRIGIKNKGNIQVGMDADITIFDFDKIDAFSDYVGYGNPNEMPAGIEYVIVNGNIIVKDNEICADKLQPGTLIR